MTSLGEMLSGHSPGQVGRGSKAETTVSAPEDPHTGERSGTPDRSVPAPSRHEAEQALATAREFLDVIRADIAARKP